MNIPDLIDQVDVEPYYHDEHGVIYNADCLEIMPKIPEGVVDLVLTDPVYGVGETKGTKGKARNHKHNYEGFEDSPEYVQKVCVPAIEMCYPKKSKRMILTPGSICLTLYPAPDSFGVFYQPATVSMQRWGRCDAQPIFYYGRDPRIGKTIQFSSIQVTEQPSVNGHPCPKPLKAWKWLLSKGSLLGDIVLDPFLGSGTTAVAAKQLGRKYVGIEISEAYCKIAIDRLAQRELF